MALATQADVEAELGRALSASEETRLPSLLTKASAMVIGYTGQDFEPAPYPETVVVVTAEMVARVLTQATVSAVMPEQQSAGPFAVRYPAATTSGGPWLTAGDKLALRSLRRSGGVTSVQMVGERYNITPPSV
jgi:hypothetical protein